MKTLYHKTAVCRAIAASPEETFSQSVLVIFPDRKYLRGLLKECAKLFFCAEEGSRKAELIEREVFCDLHLYPEPGKKLTAENLEQVVEESVLHPVEEKRKLFVFDCFDDAPALLQNKLLKLLEEPPGNVCFLVGAESEAPVLPTVRSRMKMFFLLPFSEEDIEAALAETYLKTAEGGFSREEIARAAAASGGIFSVAETLLLGGGRDFELAERFLMLRESEVFCREMGKEQNKREFFSALKAILRDMLFLRAGQDVYAKLKGEEIRLLAREYPLGAAIKALELVSEAEKQVRFNADFSSCLYALALGIEEEKEKWKRLS